MPAKRTRRFIERACVLCQSVFECRPDTKQRYCSYGCARAASSTRPTRECLRCSMPFKAMMASSKYCSMICKLGTDEQRFLSYHTQTPGCWLWTGYRHGRPGSKYGRMRWRGEMTLAHRVSWMYHVGPIPEGMKVLHKCPGGGNSLCVNPSHLAVGDSIENADDMMRDGRHWSTTGVWRPKIGEASPNAVLTEQLVKEARVRVAAGEMRKDLAVEFGVNEGTLLSAVAGQSWKHITDPPPVKSTVGGARYRSRARTNELLANTLSFG